jgi:AbrB family looped-hinge helix DNA binding protein
MPYAILNGMTLKMDKAGRVILPKPVRDRLGLRAGSDLEIEETAGGIVLRPAEQKPSMIKKQGLWVHTGKVAPGFDIVQAIRDDREERIRKLAGV